MYPLISSQLVSSTKIQTLVRVIMAFKKAKSKKKKKNISTRMKKGMQESNLRPSKSSKSVKVIESVKVNVTFDNVDMPAFQVDLTMCDGIKTQASVPTAGGIPLQGSLGCVSKIAFYMNTKIASFLVGKNPTKQFAIDKLMTMLLHEQQQQASECVNSKLPWKSIQNLFRNATFAVSLAVCRAGALARNLHLAIHIAHLAGNKFLGLPRPVLNVMKSYPYQNAIQEELIIYPIAAHSLWDAQGMLWCIYFLLSKLYSSKLSQDTLKGNRNDCLLTNVEVVWNSEYMEEALEILNSIIDDLGLTGKVCVGLEFVGPASTSDKLFNKLNLVNLKEEDNNNDNDKDAFKEVL